MPPSHEHWLYLPSVGLLAFFFTAASSTFRADMDAPSSGSLSFATARLGFQQLHSKYLIRVTAETFYRRTLAARGTSARTGLNLGQIFAKIGANSLKPKRYFVR